MKTPKRPEGNQRFAIKLKAQVAVLYSRFANNPQNALSYQDIINITNFVLDEFLQYCGECPQIVRGACQFSCGLLNPDKIEGMNQMKMGIGLLFAVAGGLGLLWGILIAMGVGMGVWATVWATIAGSGIPVFGPVAIGFGIAAIAAGVFVAVNFMSPQALSARAHDSLINAIDSWAYPEKAEQADQHVKAQLANAGVTATNDAGKTAKQ
jgi:hypothetical protein